VKRPNILYIHTHDAGRYIQPYGHAIPTPNIQRLAEEGVLFRQVFCAAPTCSPSRAAMLTGKSAHSSGMLGLSHRGFGLYDYGQHIQNTLKAAGYHTVLSGIQHVTTDPPEIGYDEILSLRREDGAAEDKAVEFLRNPPEKPFFLAVGFGDTHRTFAEPGPQEDERYCMPPPNFPDTPETRHDMACYKASARSVDNKMGKVFDALDETGLAENTLVICTTDHGIAFPQMKCNLTDHGIGVMFIMRGPGGFKGGKVCDAMISQIDLFPTLCEYLDIQPPEWLEGRSFMPVIRGEETEVNDEIFADVTFHAAYEPQRCIRTKRWKYIRRFHDRKNPVLPNCDDSPTKTLWMDHGWKEHEYATEELYDLMFDPQERRNLATDQANSDTVADLRGRLERWMERTQDPLLKGHMSPPKGARINDETGDSPNEPAIEY